MCTAFMARTEELLLEHVSKVHAHSADFQMPCIMRGCQRTYHNYGALRRHLRQTHNFYTRKTNSATVPSLGDEENPITSIDDYSDLPDREVGPPTKKKRAEWILKIKETNKLTQTCTENILQDVTHLCTSIILDLTSVVKQQLDMHNATPELSHDMMSALQSDTYNQPFKGLETHYKQMQYLRESFNFVVRPTVWQYQLDNTCIVSMVLNTHTVSPTKAVTYVLANALTHTVIVTMTLCHCHCDNDIMSLSLCH